MQKLKLKKFNLIKIIHNSSLNFQNNVKAYNILQMIRIRLFNKISHIE